MINRRLNNEDKNRDALFPIKKILIGFVCVILIFILVLFFYPKAFRSFAFMALRVKNTFSYYVLNSRPHFYYLEIEKNGKEMRASKNEALEVTYRDEFVIKSVVSDDLAGKYMSVKVEGLNKGNNDRGALLKGVELVDKIIKSSVTINDSGVVSGYKILISYRNKKIASVPLKILITPQDWFRFAKDSSNVREQIEYLKKAIELNKNDISVRKILAGIYSRLGRVDDAISQYKGALKLKPDDTIALVELAKCYIKKKEFDNAVRISRQIVKINPKEAQAYISLGVSLAEKGQWDQVIQNYREAVKIEPDNYPVRLKLAEAYKNRSMMNSAIDEYKYIAEHSRDADVALFSLGDIYLKQKKYGAAIKYYKEVIKRQPRLVAAYANLASAYAGMGKWTEELDNLKKAVSLSPNEPTVRFNLGTAYERKGMNSEAIAEYENVLRINPEDADALERIGALSLKNKKFTQAVKYYEKLAAKSSKNGDIYAKLGFAYGELKKYAASAENYEKAIKYEAKNSNLHYNLAYTYDKMGKERKAIAEYEKVSLPTKEVLSVLGGYYLKEKKCTQAINCYKRMVDLEPQKASSYSSLGYAHASCNDWDMAIKYYQIALKYDHEDNELYANLGEAYEKKGMIQEALKAYINAYELNPESTKATQKIPKLKIQLLQKKVQKETRGNEQ
ncbi:MAG: hypothetical protein APR62_06560 [Smithella sp. SDB]|nr:MAG: hypothetical protein APR62_06560 [Smithella sp. SDB]